MYDNRELCAKCNGKCCKNIPGCCYPEDFGLPGSSGEVRLREALNSGRYCIDWWEGDVRGEPYDDWEHPEHKSRCCYIRPAIVGKEGQLTDPTWSGGMCTFWVLNSGCSLTADARPTECKMLEPKDADAGERCIGHSGGKEKAAGAWLACEQLINNILLEARR